MKGDVDKTNEFKINRDHNHTLAQVVKKQLGWDKLKENTRVICFDLQNTANSSFDNKCGVL